MNSMTLSKKYTLKIQGVTVHDVEIVDEWNGLIELRGGPNQGRMIVRRKGWNNGKEWARERDAFIEQEIDIISADKRFGIPETEVIFVKPETKAAKS